MFVVDGSPELVPIAVDLFKTSSSCQRQWLDIKPETQRFRISVANIGPNRFHQNRTVSWLISIPRSCRRSSTLRSDSG